jgi:very-short-patch-repair endonuclease
MAKRTRVGDRPQRDGARDRWLKAAGIDTLRIPATDLLDDANSVLTWVVSETRARLPLHHPATPAGPPPQDKLG